MERGIIYRHIVLPKNVKGGDVVQIKFDCEGVVYDLLNSSMDEIIEEFGYDYYCEIEELKKENWTNLLHFKMKKETIENILQAQMELLFDAVCEHYKLESGDLSPLLQQRLDNCAEELNKILVQFVKLNQ